MVARARGWRLSARGAIINDRLEQGRSVPSPHCPHSPVVTLYCYNVGCNVVMHNLVMCRYNVAFTHDGLTNGWVNSCH